MRQLALGTLLLVAAGTALAGDKRPKAVFDLPPVLTRHGFGYANVPVTVTLASPIGDKSARPVDEATGGALPHNTSWVFRNPAPVWKALKSATTRRFLDGMFPGADARLIVEADSGGVRRRIHFHYRQGHGDISVRNKTPRARYRGGGWEFDPAADRALVALLSRTKPTYIGVPVQRVHQIYAKPSGDAPRIAVIQDAKALEALKPKLTWRYPRTSSWTMPKGFDWTTHLLVMVQLPRQPMRVKRLDYANARIRNGVLCWRLSTRIEDKQDRPKGTTSAVIGVFPRLRSMTHVRADIDDWAQVARRTPMSDDYHTPQPDAVFLRVQERYHTGKAWISDTHIDVRFDGHYIRTSPLRRSPGPPAPVAKSEHGRIPQDLCMRLRRAFKARPAASAMRKAPHAVYQLNVDDTKSRKPDGIQDLVDYIERVHGGP